MICEFHGTPIRNGRCTWLTRPVELDDDDHVSVRLVKTNEGRQWAQCSCGWVSSDIVGAIGVAVEWQRHLEHVEFQESEATGW